MQKLLDNLSQEIQDYYNHVDRIPLIPNTDSGEIKQFLESRYGFSAPIDLEAISNDVRVMMRNWTLHNNHPHYLGLFVPSAMLPSVIADAYTALYNPQLGAWSHSPGANEIERHVLKHLMRKFGLNPESGTSNFTTGGTEANLSAVLTALSHYFPKYSSEGLRALDKQPVFYVSEEAHHSFKKVGQITGLGAKAVRNITTDNEFKLNISDLERKLNEDKRLGYEPFLVAATAGTTSAGAIDPLPELAEFCQKHKLWYHVDAAYGGAAIMSDKLKPILKGIEKADSITCDAHKWFSVSMSAGMFFTKHKNDVARTFRAGGDYLPESGKDISDAYSTTLQCSRRFIGLKLFMTMAHLGDNGYAELVDRQTELGNYLRSKLVGAGFSIVNNTPLPVVCFTHNDIENKEITIAEILQRIYERKSFWISQTKLGGKRRVLRACITSFRTKAADIDLLMEELLSSLKSSKEKRAVVK